jgi:hypothetical protein
MLDLEIDADLLLRIGDALDAVVKETVSTRRAIQDSTTRANTYRMYGSATADTSGNALIVLDACPQGYRWVVRHVVVGGVTWETTAAGNAQLLVTSSPPTNNVDGPVSLANVVDATNNPGASAGTGLPSIAFYDEGDMIVLQPGEWLCVYVYGGTSAQQYVATARVDRHALTDPRRLD